jgi:beta-lactamase regulating signal transducer with metallopeptidase domain
MLWTLLLDVALKGLLLAAAGLATAWLLRRSSASARHMVLLLAVVTLGALPVWTMLSPLFPRVIPAPGVLVPMPAAFFSITVTPGGRGDVTAWIAALWLSVAALLLVKAFSAQWFVSRMCARAHLTGKFSGIGVRTSTEISMPFACGLWSTSILLPASSADWTAERREVVLLHEFAHAARRDASARFLGQIACALHWFNPLAWLAAKRPEASASPALRPAATRFGSARPDSRNPYPAS